MQVLIQLNEIAIGLTTTTSGTNTTDDDDDDDDDDNLEMAAQFLTIALNHASSVVKDCLLLQPWGGVESATSSSNYSSFESDNLAFESSTHNNNNSMGAVAPPHQRQSHHERQQHSELLQITNTHHDGQQQMQDTTIMTIRSIAAANAVCVLWYNLALVRSRQHQWHAARTNLSIVATLLEAATTTCKDDASNSFLHEHLVPLMAHVVECQGRRGSSSSPAARRCNAPTSTSASTHDPKEPRSISEESSSSPFQQPPDIPHPVLQDPVVVRAATWHCIHSLQATTAIVGTVFHPLVSHVLQTLGNVYAMSREEAAVSSSETSSLSSADWCCVMEQPDLAEDGSPNDQDCTLARALYNVALTVQRTLYGPTHSGLITTLQRLVTVYTRLGQNQAAYGCLQSMYDVQRSNGAAPHTLAATLWKMGVIQYAAASSYPLALDLFQQALAQLLVSTRTTDHTNHHQQNTTSEPIQQPLFHREITVTLNSMSCVLHRMHRHAAALAYGTAALQMLRDPTPRDAFRTLYHMALLHSEMGHALTALSYLEQAAEQVVTTTTTRSDERQSAQLVEERIQLFLLMARLALDETLDAQRAVCYCHEATEYLVLWTAASEASSHHDNSDDNDAATRKQRRKQRQFWIELAELRLCCGDIQGGLQICIHLARHCGGTDGSRRSSSATTCRYSFPEVLAKTHYVTKVMVRASSASAA